MLSREFDLKAAGQQLLECHCGDRKKLQTLLSKIAFRQKKQQPASRLQDQFSELLALSIEKVQRLEQWSTEIQFPDLPVSDRRDEIAKLISEHQVVVVAGETGSGKTTQLPKICLGLGLGKRGLIGHTQPRRLAARAVAGRIAEELQSSIGERVSYQIRFSDNTGPATQIKLMTDGILLAETQQRPLLDQYEVIIIDEAHERSLNIDFLLGYLKRILPQRPDLKLIITSATIDLERFSRHFNDAPIIEVSGRAYPVDIRYQDPGEMSEVEGQPEQILSVVQELIAEERQRRQIQMGDMLIFLSGEREIRETAESLRRADIPNTEILPLYARLSQSEQNRIFDLKQRRGRRIVLSTNVAETSLTVPGIRYVIDPGYARISRYSYRSKIQRLPVEAISQASANQRAGRCGRVAEGICVRMYSEEDFQGRPEFTDAEIQRTNLAAVILQMLALKMGDISAFPFVDPPDSRQINDGFNLLFELGAVDDGRKITPLGHNLSRLPVDPRIGRMVLEAAKRNALREVLIIASALSVQDPREFPADRRQVATEKHQRYADEHSDFLSWVQLWDFYEEQRQELSQNQLRKYCSKNLLSYLRMREWRDVHRQLHLVVRELGQHENKEAASYEAVHSSLLSGLLANIGQKDADKKEYLGTRNRRFHIFPGSAQFKRSPKWLLSAELVETSKLYARTVAKIEPQWVEPLASHLLKRSYDEPHWEQKKAQVTAFEQVTLYGLVVVARRKVHFGAIDTATSHAIFIRQALVEGEYHTQAPFFKHNRDLLEHVEDLEARSRRRDLLVDEEQLFIFYQEKMAALGGESVVNGRGFEAWRKKVESENPKILFMGKEDVLQRSAAHVAASLYPDSLLVNRMQIPLEYCFEPSKAEDGVTLTIPLTVLPSLKKEPLEWLVEGMLRDKVIAILKGLPKQLRRLYVPVPDVVDKWIANTTFAEGSLYYALEKGLRRITGTLVEADQFASVTLDKHFNYNIRVLDGQGKVIAESRNLDELKGRFADAVTETLQQPQDAWGQEGLTDWSFEELPDQVKLNQSAGFEIEAYPSLVDEGRAVSMRLQPTLALSQKVTPMGVARLLLLSSSNEIKRLKRLPYIDKSVLLTGKLFTPVVLQEQLLIAVALTLIEQSGTPCRRSEFVALKQQFCQQLPILSMQLSELIFQLHSDYHEIKKQLKGSVVLTELPVLNDIRGQLDGLIYERYLLETPPSQLVNIKRYLQAVLRRLERFRQQLPKERMLSEQLSEWRQLYQVQYRSLEKNGHSLMDLESFKWMLEEYRVSLFAQQLGTAYPVSEKRIKQQWKQLSTAS